MVGQQQGNLQQILKTIYDLKTRINTLTTQWNTSNNNQNYLNEFLNTAANMTQLTVSVVNSGDYNYIQAVNNELVRYGLPTLQALNEEANKIIATINTNAQAAPVYNYQPQVGQQQATYAPPVINTNYGVAQGLQKQQPYPQQPATSKYDAYAGPAVSSTPTPAVIQKSPELKIMSYPITSGSVDIALGEITFKGVVMDKLVLHKLEPVTIKLVDFTQMVLPMAQVLMEDNNVTPNDIVAVECMYEFNSNIARALADSNSVSALIDSIGNKPFNNTGISDKDKATLDSMLTNLFNAAAGTWSASPDKSIDIPSVINGYTELAGMQDLDKVKNLPDTIRNYILGLKDRGLEKVDRYIKSFSVLPPSGDDKTDALKLRAVSQTVLGILLCNDDFYTQVEIAKAGAAKYNAKYISIVQEAYPSLYYQLDTIYEDMPAFKSTGYAILIVLTSDMAIHTYKLHRVKETYFVI